MLGFCEISLLTMSCAVYNLISKVWYSVLANEAEPRRDEIETLDNEIGQWYREVSPDLRLDPVRLEQNIQEALPSLSRLRVLLYMQTNSARLSVYRPVLLSATSIMQHKDFAQRAVNIAKDTIQILTRVNRVSDIYRTQQVRFNHFLVSALAALFLAVCHAPAEFNRDVQEEFHMALDLIRDFSASSRTSRRLWATIRQLRGLFQKLDTFKSPRMDDPHSNAALAMAGLAGQPVETLPNDSRPTSLDASPQDATQMCNELTHLFEMAGSSGSGLAWGPLESRGGNNDKTNQYPDSLMRPGEERVSAAMPSAKFANDGEFIQIIGQIF